MSLQAVRAHALIGEATKIPISKSSPILSISAFTIPIPGRAVDLQIKISAPITGEKLPIILLSHGHGQSNNLSSFNGYGPLADFWAAQGFTVFQPTHLSSKTLSLESNDLFWRSRVEDMSHIIDHLKTIEAAVPHLKGRLDHSRIAVAGHSLGAHTASVLLGQTLTDSGDGPVISLKEPRIKAGVLLTPIGNGLPYLSGFAVNLRFFHHPDFTSMTTPTLVVAGDEDVSPHLTTRGADWHWDAYTFSPGPKSLVTLIGAGHLLGGISGYDAAETGKEENPEVAAVVQRLTTAYLKSELGLEDSAWKDASEIFKGLGLGKVESK